MEAAKSLVQKLKNPLILICIIALGLIAVKLSTGWPGSKTENLTPEAQVAKVVADISQFMVLPEETPTMVTIADTQALKGQPFFANAKIGDDVLVFPQASKAILWRPSEKKIIEASIITIASAPAPGT